MNTEIGLVIADVDGTLVTGEKVLTERSRAAARALRSAGIALAITSGRPPRGMGMLVEPLGLTTPIAAFNGGMLVNPDLSVIEARTLPAAVVPSIVESIVECGLDVWVYQGGDWFVRDLSAPHVAREQEAVRFAPTERKDLGGLSEGVVKIVGVSDDYPLVARCEAAVRRELGDHVSASRSQPYYLDVTHPQANKGAVVRRLSALLDISTERMASIGDMPNDVLMFGITGLSIAMGNASPDVQRTARRVTTSNDDEGFAKAMERFVLRAGP
jgi:Cof subfamily protein (haloacid dehalogenase superfamily)